MLQIANFTGYHLKRRTLMSCENDLSMHGVVNQVKEEDWKLSKSLISAII